MSSPLATTLLTAAWIAPMDRPAFRDGAIAITADRITAVGPAASLRKQFPDALVEDLGNQILLPGLINAHAHLELTGCVAGDSPATFTDWLTSLPRRIGPTPDFAASARAGAAQSLRFGVTTVGDISQHSLTTRTALRAGPLNVISFGEVLGIGATAFKVDPLLQMAIDPETESDTLAVGVSPHASYSLSWPDYARTAKTAMELRLPLATHIAELPYEREFLERHTGPLRDIFQSWGIWQDNIETFPGGPIALAKSAGLLDYPTVLAHVNYCDDDEFAMLAAGQASVAYCPRTHRYFNHPPHRWRDMLAAGINVAIGTDSCASSPDLNLVDDLRLLHEIAPDVEPQSLWKLATLNGARALGYADDRGSITPGKRADLTAFPTGADDPLREILEREVLPSMVFIAGKKHSF